MRRVVIILVSVLVGIVGLTVAAAFVLTNTNWGREKLRQRALSALNGSVHGRVRIGGVSGNLLKGVTLHDIEITDTAGAPFLKARSVTSKYGLRSFFSKRIDLTGVRIERPQIVLDRQPGQRWNWERIFRSDTTTKPKDTTVLSFGDWVMLHDVTVVDGTLRVQVPWSPDTLLTNRQRDSVIAAALSPDNRVVVTRVPGGFQQRQEYDSIHARMPLLRIALPHETVRRFEVDSLRAIAYAFRPPPAVVRQLRGAFEMNNDSVWWKDARASLPNSRIVASGHYRLTDGTMALRVLAQPAALADARFLFPLWPDSGMAHFDLTYATRVDTSRPPGDVTAQSQTVLMRDADVRIGAATLRGRLGLELGDTLLVHDTDLTFASLDTKLLAQLVPALASPRAGVLTGHTVVDGSLDAMRVNGDVTFDDRLTGRNRVIAMGELGASHGVFQARGLRVRLAPVQMAIARMAMPKLPIGGTVNGGAMIDGSTATRLDVTGIDLSHDDRGEHSRVTGRAAVRLPNGSTPTRVRVTERRTAVGGEVALPQTSTRSNGAPWFDVNLDARTLSLATVGRFAPAVGLRGWAAGPVQATGTLNDFLLNSALRTNDGGRVSARGRLGFGGTPRYDLAVVTILFNTNAVLKTAPATSLSGTVLARGRGFDPATMTAELRAAFLASMYDSVAVDTARASVHIASGVASIDTLALRAPRAAVDALGTFGLTRNTSGTLTYSVVVDSLATLRRFFPGDTGTIAPRPATLAGRLAAARADSAQRAQRFAVAMATGEVPPQRLAPVDTPRAVPRDSLAGAVKAAGRIQGGLFGFDLRGNATATKLVVSGNAVEKARAEYAWLGAQTPGAAIAAAAVATNASVSGYALDSINARLTYRKPGGLAQLVIFQDTAQEYSARADYNIYPDRKEVLLRDLRLRFDTAIWNSARTGAIRWGQPGIEIDSIDLRNGPSGRLFANGRLPSTGPANLDVIVNDFEVGNVLSILQSDLAVRGRVTLETHLTGTSAAPSIAGTVAVQDASYGGTPVPGLRAKLDYANQLLRTEARIVRDSARVGSAEGPQLASISGSIPVNLAISGVTGSRLPDAPVSFDLRADSVPLELVSRFTDVVSNVKGYMVGTAQWRGTLRTPKLNGDIGVALGSMRVVPLGVNLSSISGGVRLRGDTVLVDSLVGYSGGLIRIAGGLGIKQIAKPSIDLRVRADNARVLDNERGNVLADAQIAAYGPFASVRVSGGAKVRQGVLYIPEPTDKQVISASDPSLFHVADTTNAMVRELLPVQSPLLANLRADVRLSVDRDTWVRSREANIEIYTDGDLRVAMDRRTQAVALEGVVLTDRGDYTLLGKRFQVRAGSVQFIGTSDINPLLQIGAIYNVLRPGREALTIRVLIGGTLDAPKLTLESDAQPPISQSDLLSYLAFGSESSTLLQGQGASSLTGGGSSGNLIGASAALASRQLAAVALGVAVDQLEGQAARSLGADVLEITPADVPLSGGFKEGRNFLEGTRVEFGRYFQRNTFLAITGQGFRVAPGMQLQHRFARFPGLSLEAAYDTRFLLREPSLDFIDPEQRKAFGMFLKRTWRF